MTLRTPPNAHVDPFGDHVFQCKRICKIGAHNAIRDGFTTTLAPILSTAGFLLPTSKLDVKPLLYLPSNPHAGPFDISFNPDPASPPQANHACPYTTIGFDITNRSPAPCPSFDPTSRNLTNILSANADSHLQKQEQKKLGRNKKKFHHWNFNHQQQSHWQYPHQEHDTDPFGN